MFTHVLYFSLQPACVCMCWNLGHPLWLCVWEADQSIWRAARPMGVIVWGHAHTGLHLPLCLYEPERKSIYCMRHLRCPQCFPCANRLTRSRNRRHSHLNCSHTDTLMQFLCSSLFATLFLPRTQNVSISLQCPPYSPPPNQHTHAHTHHFLSHSQGGV